MEEQFDDQPIVAMRAVMELLSSLASGCIVAAILLCCSAVGSSSQDRGVLADADLLWVAGEVIVDCNESSLYLKAVLRNDSWIVGGGKRTKDSPHTVGRKGEDNIFAFISDSVTYVTALAVRLIFQQIDSYHGYWNTFVDGEKIEMGNSLHTARQTYIYIDEVILEYSSMFFNKYSDTNMLGIQTKPLLCCIMLFMNVSFSNQVNGGVIDRNGTAHTFGERRLSYICPLSRECISTCQITRALHLTAFLLRPGFSIDYADSFQRQPVLSLRMSWMIRDRLGLFSLIQMTATATSTALMTAHQTRMCSPDSMKKNTTTIHPAVRLNEARVWL